ncbi:MAG TPA: AtpZ/AtpI family protein [Candidatus Omnitrophota bacterium]|nr:AtpZ/AtpI family protein [Candidatus Omnitrophota bacterium]HRZ14144.1 AtpZ/AtpI family protein [Candidatus Omnitrophota bacterium]
MSKNASWQLWSLSSLGITMIVATALGLGIGLAIDKRFGSSPLFTLVFLILGIAAGFWQVIKEIKKLSDDT